VDLNKARYELTAVKPSQYPSGSMPEVALVGRSNVGKSTIINMLLNRRNLARVSSEPGKTRGINFYNIDDALYLVDLPGYGYAKVSKEKKVSWGDIIETYLNRRQQLGMIVMLVDIRHAPSEEDRVMYGWILEQGLEHLVVATKMDKISRGQVFGRLNEIKKVLGLREGVRLIPYSSETKQGRDDIWKEINGTLQRQNVGTPVAVDEGNTVGDME
jgi:GTP-binding protein